MGGESLGTYSIEVDSASRPCVEACAICAGEVNRLIVVQWRSVVKKKQVCLRLGCKLWKKENT